jgi:hypothetical protein
MKKIVFTGMDEADLNKKQWEWQTTGGKKTILEQWPDERLPLTMKPPQAGRKIEFSDQVSRRIEYED